MAVSKIADWIDFYVAESKKKGAVQELYDTPLDGFDEMNKDYAGKPQTPTPW